MIEGFSFSDALISFVERIYLWTWCSQRDRVLDKDAKGWIFSSSINHLINRGREKEREEKQV